MSPLQFLNSWKRTANTLTASLSLLVSAISAPAQGQWVSQGTLNIPKHSYSFLAATPSGDVLAATYNTNAAAGQTRELPALLIKDPMNVAPQVIELCRTTFDPQRGYSGIACDPTGSFFVAGDTGDATTSFVKKFKYNGSPDTTFGKGGEIHPGHRCLGLDTIGNHLLLAVDWGQIQMYDLSTGQLRNVVKSTGSAPALVRDIAIDPKSLRLFGVAQGGLVTWGGGSPWLPEGYKFRTVVEPMRKPRAGEGVSIDPLRRTVLITHTPGNELVEVAGNGARQTYPISSAAADSQLSDSVLSFDGSTLFVSDLIGMQVHMLKRDVALVAQAMRNSAGPMPSPEATLAQPAPPVNWVKSYSEALEQARANKQPMIVYFRLGTVGKCAEVEKGILLSDDFKQRARGYVCVFENVDKDRLLAYRFGVFQVPHIVVLDPTGDTISDFRYDIVPRDLYGAMDAGRHGPISERVNGEAVAGR